ncbi:hypothetical protein O181_034029 [Austropuccinia psidii MF-1]|uniref:Uncharacterized protein n=1 Tax=Austropuccinia psidii MF-1 TaxID=1389203 RepID=A0A9Q3D056_9BASI|nr:hypothetical protein [Austropuccinia psidii MF-1]
MSWVRVPLGEERWTKDHLRINITRLGAAMPGCSYKPFAHFADLKFRERGLTPANGYSNGSSNKGISNGTIQIEQAPKLQKLWPKQG